MASLSVKTKPQFSVKHIAACHREVRLQVQLYSSTFFRDASSLVWSQLTSHVSSFTVPLFFTQDISVSQAYKMQPWSRGTFNSSIIIVLPHSTPHCLPQLNTQHNSHHTAFHDLYLYQPELGAALLFQASSPDTAIAKSLSRLITILFGKVGLLRQPKVPLGPCTECFLWLLWCVSLSSRTPNPPTSHSNKCFQTFKEESGSFRPIFWVSSISGTLRKVLHKGICEYSWSRPFSCEDSACPSGRVGGVVYFVPQWDDNTPRKEGKATPNS